MSGPPTYSLPAYSLLIDGSPRPAASGAAREATSPGHGGAFATVAWGGREDAGAAVEAASRAAPSWAGLPAGERAGCCFEAASAIGAARASLVATLTEDQGKPLAEAGDEVDELVVYFRMAGEDATRLL
ncbi:MAG: aldehyde dehydrogenase family protein, partial [Acidimicrobiales bacterium]